MKEMKGDTVEIRSLDQLLDRIGEAAQDNDEVSMDNIMDSVGRRSFGPMLLIAGLITLMPLIGDIPGVPTIFGIFVILVAGQILLGRSHFWLPGWMLNRSIKSKKVLKGVDVMRKPVRWVDKWMQPRWKSLVDSTGTYGIAIVCLVIGLAMPFMEVVPFSATGAGAALTAFGLALTARDGLLALVAFILTAATAGLIVYLIM